MTFPLLPEIPVDQANQLLAERPARLLTALMQTPAGQRLAVTIRTETTTLTVQLQFADAKAWAKLLLEAAGQMSASGLVVASGSLNGGGSG